MALLIVAIMVLVIWVAYTAEMRERERDLAAGVGAVRRLWNREIDSETRLMRTALATLARDEELRAALGAGDRARLLDRARPLFARLRARGGITHFYFMSPAREVLLRVHEPADYGDRIERSTLRRAARSGRSAAGLELGPLGTLTLRVVEPWMAGGRLLGYVELGKPIDALLAALQAMLGYDLVALVEKRHLERQGWRLGARIEPRPLPWERLRDVVVLASTLRPIPAALLEEIDRPRRLRAEPVALRDSGRLLYVSSRPLRDAARQRLGELLVVRDVTTMQARFRDSLALTVSFVILAGTICFVVLYAVLDRVVEDYRRHDALADQLSHVSARHQRAVQVEKLSALGLMVSEVAHQLNNSLVGVVSMAELAAREPGLEAGTRELLDEIRRAGASCRDFVERLLAFSRVAHFERRTSELGGIVEDTVALVHQSGIGEARIEVHLPGRPVTLELDPVLVRHALFNLVTNAVQAAPGGTIEVRVEPRSRPHGEEPGWAVRVLDRGPGIPEDLRVRVFEPFFSTREQGTGLGLPVVRYVVLLHDGEVTVEDRPGGGAELAMWLPRNAAATPPGLSPGEVAGAAGGIGAPS